MIFNCYVVSKD